MRLEAVSSTRAGCSGPGRSCRDWRRGRRRSPCNAARSIASGYSETGLAQLEHPCPKSAATGSLRARSRICSAWSIAAIEPIVPACAAGSLLAPRGPSRRSIGCARRRRIGAVEGLLEPPVGQDAGRDPPFEVAELLERRLDRAVGQERSPPVLLQGEEVPGRSRPRRSVETPAR